MCGHDLRIQPRRRQRVSLTDALLVLAVLAVLVVWWRLGTRPQQEAVVAGEEDGILPTNIPVLSGTTRAAEQDALHETLGLDALLALERDTVESPRDDSVERDE